MTFLSFFGRLWRFFLACLGAVPANDVKPYILDADKGNEPTTKEQAPPTTPPSGVHGQGKMVTVVIGNNNLGYTQEGATYVAKFNEITRLPEPNKSMKKPFGFDKQDPKQEEDTQELQPVTDEKAIVCPVPDGQVNRIDGDAKSPQPTNNDDGDGDGEKLIYGYCEKVNVVNEVIGNDFRGELEEGGTYNQEMDGIPNNIPKSITPIQVPSNVLGKSYNFVGRVIGNSNCATVPRQATFNQRFTCSKAAVISTVAHGTAVQAEMQHQVLEETLL